jgi:MHS family proline/betaine transporter-like MFS transporter
MRKSERAIILPITLGSMFEWFEVFLYNYWAPLMAQNFFDLTIPFAEFIYAILILGTGFIARPFGGIIFGYIGDKWGRRTSFLLSIVCITIPSLGVVFMPSFSSWAYASLVYIGLMRFLQGIPAGGELPGALCLLSEGASPGRKRYLCSYLFVGPQIGQILSMLLCFSLEKYLSHEQLIDWGWRLSFFIASIIGIIGFFFRRTLHESKAFENLKTEHKIEQNPLRASFKNHKKNMLIALFISLFEVVGFFMIYFYLFQNATEILKINSSYSIIIYAFYLIILTIMMPIFGSIEEKYKSRSLFKLSAIGVAILSVIFYFSILNNSVLWMFILLSIIILFLCIQFSLLPSFIAGLFPTGVRFTCIAFSFNITDGVIGGLVPSIGGWITNLTGEPGAFTLLFPITAVIFLVFLRLVKNPPEQYNKAT